MRSQSSCAMRRFNMNLSSRSDNSRCRWHTHSTNNGYSDYRKNPNTPNLSPHAGIKMAQVLGPSLYICSTTTIWGFGQLISVWNRWMVDSMCNLDVFFLSTIMRQPSPTSDVQILAYTGWGLGEGWVGVGWDTHMLRHTGMCAQMGYFFTKNPQTSGCTHYLQIIQVPLPGLDSVIGSTTIPCRQSYNAHHIKTKKLGQLL